MSVLCNGVEAAAMQTDATNVNLKCHNGRVLRVIVWNYWEFQV